MRFFLTAITAVLCVLGTAYAKDVHLVEKDGVKVTVVTAPFDKERHTLSFKTFEGHPVLLEIDGQEYSGSDGYVPHTEILSLAIEILGVHYEFPHSSFASLFNPQLGSKYRSGVPRIAVSPGRVSVSFSGGDAAGSYRVQWEIDTHTLSGARYLNEYPNPESSKREPFTLVKVK